MTFRHRLAPPPALGCLLILSIGGIPHPASAQPQAPPPCSSPEATQFDFWVGEWEVRTPDGTVAGHNTIQKILNGCVLLESYSTPKGYSGQSFNMFDSARGVWHQTWVDVGGLLLMLEGGFQDGKMTLEGETVGADGPVKQRISWNLVDENPDRVRQLWEASTDGGKSWTTAFDGLYVRMSPSPLP